MKHLLAAAAALAFSVAPASAAIISGSITGGSVLGSGSFVELDPTQAFSVGQDSFNTNNLYAFDEAQDFTLTQDLITNLGLANIAAGTRVSSHFVFFDPQATQTLQGTIVFDAPVIAAITLRPGLIASNYLRAPAVNYLMPAAVGIDPGVDFLTLGSPDAKSLRLNSFTSDSPGDHFRVITLVANPVAAVPEPATWLSMILGFGLIGGALRRRKLALA